MHSWLNTISSLVIVVVIYIYIYILPPSSLSSALLKKGGGNAYWSELNTYLCFLSVVGEKEKNGKLVNVRTRDNKVHGEKSIDDVIVQFKSLAKTRIINSEDDF